MTLNMKLSCYIWFWILAISNVLAADHCDLKVSEKTGFNANFYNFKYLDISSADSVDYMSSNYKSLDSMLFASEVSNPLISFTEGDKKNTIYGSSITSQNFLVELTGYFKAPEDGKYKFQLEYTDDSAMVFFGASSAFDCGDVNSIGSKEYLLYNNFFDKDSKSAELSLIKGDLYPLRVIYLNVVGGATLDFWIQTPSGEKIETDWSKYIFQYDGEAQTSCDLINFGTSKGFDAAFYEYKNGDTDSGKSTAFMSTNYRQNKLEHSTTEVTKPNFKFDKGIPLLPTTIYGYTTVVHFVLELTGYFKAPETGSYLFKLGSVDDSAMVLLGASVGFECGSNTIGSQSYLLFDSSVTSTDNYVEVNLKEGEYYPLRIVYLNWKGAGELEFSIRTPKGSVISDDWSGYIYQYETQSPDLCEVKNVASDPGFNANFYNFKLNDFIGASSSKYMGVLYRSGEIVHSSKKIVSPAISFPETQDKATVYGYQLSSQNFLVEVTGYFKAPEDGTYIFQLDWADDSAIAFIGANDAFTCGSGDVAATGDVKDYISFNGYGTSDSSQNQIVFQKGEYYPMRLVYLNVVGGADFSFSITTPSGLVIKDDWSDYVFQYDPGESESCSLANIGSATGFVAKFYDYTEGDKTSLSDVDYMSTNYRNKDLKHTTDAVNQPLFSFSKQSPLYPLLPPGPPTIYGYQTSSNFLLELTGYFKASETGQYTFEMSVTDDASIVFIGGSKAFDCTTNEIGSTSYAVFQKFGNSQAQHAEVTLTQGSYYPIRIVYVNAQGAGKLDFSITTPSGRVIGDDWSGFIYQYNEHSIDSCDAEQLVEETGFEANFYSYKSGDKVSANDVSYMSTGYSDQDWLHVSSGIANPSFSFSDQQTTNTIYDYHMTNPNFVVELRGYFKAPESGVYVFAMGKADDSAMAFMGASDAFSCDDGSVGSESYLIFNTVNDVLDETEVTLESGKFYPIRVVYANVYGAAELSFSLTTPSGTKIINDWSKYIYQFKKSGNCELKNAGSAQGFKADFYEFTLGDTASTADIAYMSSNYKSKAIVHSSSKISNPSIEFSDSSVENTVYGYSLTSQNFLVELKGYFRASETGTHAINLKFLDDSAVIFFGASKAFSCDDETTDSDSYLLFNNLGDSNVATVSLVQGEYYPIRVVYLNAQGAANLDFTIEFPSGAIIENNWSDYIFQSDGTGSQASTKSTTSNGDIKTTSSASTMNDHHSKTNTVTSTSSASTMNDHHSKTNTVTSTSTHKTSSQVSKSKTTSSSSEKTKTSHSNEVTVTSKTTHSDDVVATTKTTHSDDVVATTKTTHSDDVVATTKTTHSDDVVATTKTTHSDDVIATTKTTHSDDVVATTKTTHSDDVDATTKTTHSDNVVTSKTTLTNQITLTSKTTHPVQTHDPKVPYLEGFDKNGEPFWYLTIPAALLDGKNVTIISFSNSNYNYKCQNFTITSNHVLISNDHYTINCINKSINISLFSLSGLKSPVKVALYTQNSWKSDQQFSASVWVSSKDGDSGKEWNLANNVSLSKTTV